MTVFMPWVWCTDIPIWCTKACAKTIGLTSTSSPFRQVYIKVFFQAVAPSADEILFDSSSLKGEKSKQSHWEFSKWTIPTTFSTQDLSFFIENTEKVTFRTRLQHGTFLGSHPKVRFGGTGQESEVLSIPLGHWKRLIVSFVPSTFHPSPLRACAWRLGGKFLVVEKPVGIFWLVLLACHPENEHEYIPK